MAIETVRQITAPLLSDPKGVDAYVQGLQLILAANLEWLSASYGKATRQKDYQVEGGGERIIPKVYINNREFVSVEPDQSFPAMSFFYESVGATETFIPELKRQTSLNLIVFANLEQIDPDNDTLFLEDLKEQVLTVLRNNESLTIDFDTLTIYKGIDDTYTDFSFGQEENRDYFTQNYAAFRIQFDATYLAECIVPVKLEATNEGLFIVTSEGLYIKIVES